MKTTQKRLNCFQKRNGNQQLISSRISKRIPLERVTGGNITQLRKLYDSIESHVSALSSAGINSEHLGPIITRYFIRKDTGNYTFRAKSKIRKKPLRN